MDTLENRTKRFLESRKKEFQAGAEHDGNLNYALKLLREWLEGHSLYQDEVRRLRAEQQPGNYTDGIERQPGSDPLVPEPGPGRR